MIIKLIAGTTINPLNCEIFAIVFLNHLIMTAKRVVAFWGVNKRAIILFQSFAWFKRAFKSLIGRETLLRLTRDQENPFF